MFQSLFSFRFLCRNCLLGLVFVLSMGQPLAAPTQRILGGTVVPTGAYPWMAAILTRGGDTYFDQYCGGSLIHANWVMTAAHCVVDEPESQVEVLLGQEDLDGSGGDRISVKRVIVHPDYFQAEDPDIALLELSRPATQTPLPLLREPSVLDDPGHIARVIGWGLIGPDGIAPNDLMQVDLPIVSHSICNAAYDGTLVEETMLCAGPAAGGKDSCQGDSGGPLFVANGNSGWLQAGIVSFGDECGMAGSYGVYTRVSGQVAWVQSQMGSDLLPGSSSEPLLGALESPSDGSRQSGVGVVRGWVCNAALVEMQIDNQARKRILWGGSRSDTSASCGDVNNGFGTVVNYNLIGDGSHTLKLYVDNQLFKTVQFTVTTLGENFLQGGSATRQINDFPSPGDRIIIQWSQEHQNFVISGATLN